MEILIGMVIACRTCGGDVGEVFQNYPFENTDVHRIGGVFHEGINAPLIISCNVRPRFFLDRLNA